MKKLLSLLVLTLALASPAYATEYMSVSELEEGMRGYGLTVVEGTDIERFNVRIIDVQPTGGLDGGPMIFAEFSGGAVAKSGGIASGYSGSPVYINGKMIGAVSIAFPFTEGMEGGITPINSMLEAVRDKPAGRLKRPVIPPGNKLFEPREDEGDLDARGGPLAPPDIEREQLETAAAMYEPGTASGEQPATVEGSPVYYADTRAAAEKLHEKHPSARIGVPLKAPLLLSGASRAALEKIRPVISEYTGIDARRIRLGGAGLGEAESAKLLRRAETGDRLEPGDAVTVTLATGDVELYALGTVTEVTDDDKVLIFGHSMLNEGETALPFAKGYVVNTVDSIQQGFKNGVPIGDILGTLTSDRAAAVAGEFGKQPPMVPVSFQIHNNDTGHTKHFAFEVARHEQFTPTLVFTGVLQKSMQFLDRQPGGTVHYRIKIESEDLDGPIEIEDFHYDYTFAPFTTATELQPVLALLTNNNFRETNISRIGIELDITKERKNASIEQIEVVCKQGARCSTEMPRRRPQGTPKQPGRTPQQPASVSPEVERIYGLHPAVGDGGLPVQTPPQQAGQQQPGGQQQAQGPTQMPVTVYPGEPFQINLRLHPYRKPVMERSLTVTLPDDFPTGTTMVQVQGGGGLMSFGGALGGGGRMLVPTQMFSSVPESPKDLDEILDALEHQQTNNQVVISIIPPVQPNQATSARRQLNRAYQIVIPTRYVIYNQAVVPLNIGKPKKGGDDDQKEGGDTPEGEESLLPGFELN